MVDEPTPEDAISILRGIKDKYELHHGVRVKDNAIIAAVQLSHRYLPDRFLPDKAIDLIDEAAAKDPDKRLSDWVVASYREKETLAENVDQKNPETE